jgi:hypothetical protein
VLICICSLSRTRFMPIWNYCWDRTLCQFSVNLCNINSCLYLKILCVDSDKPTKIQDVDNVSTFVRSLHSHFFMECSLRYALLKIVVQFALFCDQFVQYMFKLVLRDHTCLIWEGFSNESCSWVRADTWKFYLLWMSLWN